MLDSIIEKLGSVLSEDELDFMIKKLATEDPSLHTQEGPYAPPKPPPVKPGKPASSGDNANWVGTGEQPKGGQEGSPGTDKPKKPGMVERVETAAGNRLDDLGNAAGALNDAGGKVVDEVTGDNGDLGKIPGHMHEGIMGASRAVAPAPPEQWSDQAKSTYHGLIGYGLPAATALAVMAAIMSEKKKKEQPGLSKLQSAKSLEVYLRAYLQDNGVIN